MAEHHSVTYQEGPISEQQKAQEFVEHASTYAFFVRLTKWVIGVVVAILVLMYLFLVL